MEGKPRDRKRRVYVIMTGGGMHAFCDVDYIPVHARAWYKLVYVLANLRYCRYHRSSDFDRYYNCFKSSHQRFRHRTRLLRFDRLREQQSRVRVSFFPISSDLVTPAQFQITYQPQP
jgi:hypothetical protein